MIFAGVHVKAGKYGEWVTHYRVLRTLAQADGLKPLGRSANTTPITDVSADARAGSAAYFTPVAAMGTERVWAPARSFQPKV
jgi:hypothetical protein